MRASKPPEPGAPSSPGYAFLHHAVDFYSRLVYSEQLTDERKETAAAFWERARAFFAKARFEVAAVMTDNGSCYRSHTFIGGLTPAQCIHNVTGNHS